MKLLRLALLALAACGGGGDPVDDFVAKTRAHRDKVCACKTAECAEAAFQAWHDWDAEAFDKLGKDPTELKPKQIEALTDLNTEMVKCERAAGGK
jgi:hypothetical protein